MWNIVNRVQYLAVDKENKDFLQVSEWTWDQEKFNTRQSIGTLTSNNICQFYHEYVPFYVLHLLFCFVFFFTPHPCWIELQSFWGCSDMSECFVCSLFLLRLWWVFPTQQLLIWCRSWGVLEATWDHLSLSQCWLPTLPLESCFLRPASAGGFF